MNTILRINWGKLLQCCYDQIFSWWVGDNDTGQAILVLFSSNLAHHYLCEPWLGNVPVCTQLIQKGVAIVLQNQSEWVSLWSDKWGRYGVSEGGVTWGSLKCQAFIRVSILWCRYTKIVWCDDKKGRRGDLWGKMGTENPTHFPS